MILGTSISILSTSSAGTSVPGITHLKVEQMTNAIETYTTHCEDI